MGGVIGLLLGVAGAAVVWIGLRRDTGSMKFAGTALLIGAILLQVMAGGHGSSGGTQPDILISAPFSSPTPSPTPSPMRTPVLHPSAHPSPHPSPSRSTAPPTTNPPTTNPPTTHPPPTHTPTPTPSHCSAAPAGQPNFATTPPSPKPSC